MRSWSTVALVKGTFFCVSVLFDLSPKKKNKKKKNNNKVKCKLTLRVSNKNNKVKCKLTLRVSKNENEYSKGHKTYTDISASASRDTAPCIVLIEVV